jgi:hypothetical protein
MTTLLKIPDDVCPAAGHRAGGHYQAYSCFERRGYTAASGGQHKHFQVIVQADTASGAGPRRDRSSPCCPDVGPTRA